MQRSKCTVSWTTRWWVEPGIHWSHEEGNLYHSWAFIKCEQSVEHLALILIETVGFWLFSGLAYFPSSVSVLVVSDLMKLNWLHLILWAQEKLQNACSFLSPYLEHSGSLQHIGLSGELQNLREKGNGQRHLPKSQLSHTPPLLNIQRQLTWTAHSDVSDGLVVMGEEMLRERPMSEWAHRAFWCQLSPEDLVNPTNPEPV